MYISSQNEVELVGGTTFRSPIFNAEPLGHSQNNIICSSHVHVVIYKFMDKSYKLKTIEDKNKMRTIY